MSLQGFLLLLTLLVTFKRTHHFPPFPPLIFELPHELLLAILQVLPDYAALASILHTHPTFHRLIHENRSTITTSIASALFGASNLPHIQTLFRISTTGAYTPVPPTLTPDCIPKLLILRKALDHAVPHYISHAKRTIPWLRMGPRATAVPVFVEGEDEEAVAVIERCFIRVYSVAIVLFHSPVDNSRMRLRALRGTRGVENELMFGAFFRAVPREEVILVRSCLARLVEEESGLFIILPESAPRSRRENCLRGAKDVLMWDYDFGAEAGLLE